jgi:hypothetical protein
LPRNHTHIRKKLLAKNLVLFEIISHRKKRNSTPVTKKSDHLVENQ